MYESPSPDTPSIQDRIASLEHNETQLLGIVARQGKEIERMKTTKGYGMSNLILNHDAVRMEYFRRYPDSKRSKEFAKHLVSIRSSDGIWRENAAGFTNKKSEAGLFTLREAAIHTFHCGPEKHVVYLIAGYGNGDGELPVDEALKENTARAALLQ